MKQNSRKSLLKGFSLGIVVQVIVSGLTIVGSVYSNQALAAKKPCDLALARDFKKADLKDNGNEGSKATVVIERSEKGRFGGRLLVLKRVGKEWGSSFTDQESESYYYYQGDPRNFVMAVGLKTAGFFGFKYLDDKTMIVPDVEEFNNALQVLNQQLIKMKQEPILINFYPSEDVGLDQQMTNFEKNMGVAIATEGHRAISDTAHLYSSILTPQELLDVANANLRVGRAFIRYLGKNIETKTMISKILMQGLKDHVSGKISYNIKMGLRYVTNTLVGVNYGTAKERAQALNDSFLIIRELTFDPGAGQKTPEHTTKAWLNYFRDTDFGVIFLFKGIQLDSSLKKAITDFKKLVAEQVNNFIAEQKNNNDMKAKYRRSTDDLVNSMKARVQILETAVDQIK